MRHAGVFSWILLFLSLASLDAAETKKRGLLWRLVDPLGLTDPTKLQSPWNPRNPLNPKSPYNPLHPDNPLNPRSPANPFNPAFTLKCAELLSSASVDGVVYDNGQRILFWFWELDLRRQAEWAPFFSRSYERLETLGKSLGIAAPSDEYDTPFLPAWLKSFIKRDVDAAEGVPRPIDFEFIGPLSPGKNRWHPHDIKFEPSYFRDYALRYDWKWDQEYLSDEVVLSYTAIDTAASTRESRFILGSRDIGKIKALYAARLDRVLGAYEEAGTVSTGELESFRALDQKLPWHRSSLFSYTEKSDSDGGRRELYTLRLFDGTGTPVYAKSPKAVAALEGQNGDRRLPLERLYPHLKLPERETREPIFELGRMANLSDGTWTDGVRPLLGRIADYLFFHVDFNQVSDKAGTIYVLATETARRVYEQQYGLRTVFGPKELRIPPGKTPEYVLAITVPEFFVMHGYKHLAYPGRYPKKKPIESESK